ncbi:MAG: TIGR02206 family membrane protein [Spirochaetales bacterium]|nr:TIGR02206 family membrane protein [Spirochaetales bacterium]
MPDFLGPEYMKGMFHIFSFSHFTALFIILFSCIAIVLWLKNTKNDRTRLIFCIILSVLLLVQEATRSIWHVWIGDFSWGEHLPLHLCGVGIILGPVMLLKKNYALYELIYFWGFGGAVQALLTPDLLYGFPHYIFFQYFLSHGLIIIACVYMTFVVGFRPTWKSLFKVFIITNIYMGIMALVNLATNGNYMFLCEKPVNPTIYDFLGPWPWYILSVEGIGIIVMLVFYSPFVIKDMVVKLRKKADNPA